jgi:hypothetical protein
MKIKTNIKAGNWDDCRTNCVENYHKTGADLDTCLSKCTF